VTAGVLEPAAVATKIPLPTSAHAHATILDFFQTFLITPPIAPVEGFALGCPASPYSTGTFLAQN
jgi:hypothetical protein